uniref:Opr5 n=1 Tax=Arundo donax TaxID=35708 RepID=A0A0A8Y3T9_ARUDO
MLLSISTTEILYTHLIQLSDTLTIHFFRQMTK